ncbi:MAG: TonB-dependent receptor [Thermodesulfovibrio sp.]|nr:TonB-dependent receptor [Thermodesulfovibrio sp.]
MPEVFGIKALLTTINFDEVAMFITTARFLKKTLHAAAIAFIVFIFPPAPGWASSGTDETVAMASLLTKGLAELIELDVAIATGTLKPLKLAPSVATVITAQDIEDMGAATLDEILETVPGLHVQPSATNVFTSTWSIRGVYSQLNPQVLLLIDGQSLKSNNNGGKPASFRMPVSTIARIEIIRGPGSAVLGADAFAGAINIITKDGRDINGSNAGFRGGSFGSYDLWAQHGGSYRGWDVALGAEYAKGEGDKKRIIEKDALGSGYPSLAPGPLDTHYETFNTSLTVTREKFRLNLNGFWMLGNGIGAGVSNTLNSGRSRADSHALLASLVYTEKELVQDFDLTTRVSGSYNWGRNTFYFFPPDYRNAIGRPGVKELNGGIEFTGDYRKFNDHRIRLSFGINNFNTDTFQEKNYGPGIPVQFGPLVDISNTPYVYLKDQHRRLSYAGIQDEWAFARNWALTAGVRYDDYSDFGNAISPRIAIVWKTAPELVTKLLYGRAFRPPTFGELHQQNNPATIGNNNLDAETINTYELAFDYRPLRALRFGLNLFEYRIKGLIDYLADPAPATTKTAQNARDQKGRGFEVETEWVATEALKLRANFSYQRSTDSATGAVVPDVPAMKFYANAHWKFMPEWSVDGQYFRVMDRHRAAGDTRPKIKDYDLVNMTLRKKNILKHCDLAVAVRNLFDNDAREPGPAVIPNDYPLQHRSFWAELRYSF